MYPILLTPFAKPGRPLDNSINEYFTPNNVRRRLAAQALLTNTDGKGVRDGVSTYVAVTFLNKFLEGYRHRLHNFKQNHPGCADFTNRHPIMGNAIAWLPGLLATIPLFIISTLLLRKGADTRIARSILDNKLVKIGATVVAGAWALLTAFPVLLGKNAVKEHRGLKQNLNDAQKLNPDVDRSELKPIVKNIRHQTLAERAYVHSPDARWN